LCVTSNYCLRHFIVRRGLSNLVHFLPAPLATDSQGSIEKKFYRRLWEHHSANIPPFHHQGRLTPETPQLAGHPLPHRRQRSDR
jgi:hypothetical protein